MNRVRPRTLYRGVASRTSRRRSRIPRTRRAHAIETDVSSEFGLTVRWPGVIDSGRETDEFVDLLDLFPTLCGLTGAETPDTDGRDLRALFEGDPADWREAVFAEYHGEPETLYTQRMIRTDRFKFVYNGPDINEVYDLETDPHELHNLIDHPAYEDTRLELADRLGDWMERTDDHVRVDRYRRRTSTAGLSR